MWNASLQYSTCCPFYTLLSKTMSLLKRAALIACLFRRTPHMGERFYTCRGRLWLIFPDFALCGPDKFLPLSESGQLVSASMSKALRLLGLSFASQDSRSMTSFCLFMTELADPFGTTVVLHLASSHMVVKIRHRMPRPIFMQTSSQKRS
jgi:hypothetical protein